MDLITKLNFKTSQSKYHRLFGVFSELFWIRKIDLLMVDLLTWEPPSLPRMRRHLDFSFGDESDVTEINTNPALGAKGYELHNEQIFRSGDKLFVGRINGEIIFYVWLVFKKSSMYDKFFILKNQEFMGKRAFTHKNFRFLGVYSYAVIFMLSQMKHQGFLRAFVDIDTHNITSLLSTTRLGFQVTGTSCYIYRLFLKDYLVSHGPLTERFIKKSTFSEAS